MSLEAFWTSSFYWWMLLEFNSSNGRNFMSSLHLYTIPLHTITSYCENIPSVERLTRHRKRSWNCQLHETLVNSDVTVKVSAGFLLKADLWTASFWNLLCISQKNSLSVIAKDSAGFCLKEDLWTISFWKLIRASQNYLRQDDQIPNQTRFFYMSMYVVIRDLCGVE